MIRENKQEPEYSTVPSDHSSDTGSPEPLYTDWVVYLVRCVDNSLYAGITRDIKRRLRQHNGELAGGARYTRSRQPVILVWQSDTMDRSGALRLEHRVKALPRAQKLHLIAHPRTAVVEEDVVVR